jgi:hypothetical protein
MLSYRKALVSCCLVISLLMSPLYVLAGTVEKGQNKVQNSPVAMTIDLIILRPLGLVATLGGTLIFVVSSPFSALGGNLGEAWNSLVVTPAEYTFKRPLGDSD